MDSNSEVYSNSRVVEYYNKLSGLYEAEKKLFDRFGDLIRKANLLDIGIGAGRTTSFLLGACRQYCGIDYSAEFIKLCREKFPQADLRVADARNMREFPDQRFDVVNFSFNGIDSVDLQGREKIISEIHRVLKPGGLFLFSTHNKRHHSFGLEPWQQKNISFYIKLKSFIKLLPFFPKKLMNKKKQIITADYGIINDSAHNYSLFNFYTSPSFLRSQLLKQGFEKIELYSAAGSPAADNLLDEWIYVSCFAKSFLTDL